MGRRRDAALAAVALLAVVAAALAADAPPAPGAVVVGAAGGVALEGVTQLRPAAVRRAWERPAVQAAAVVATLAAAVVGTRLFGPAAPWALAGGLAAYLGLLGVVAVARRRG